MKKSTITIVVPCHNEEDNIDIFVEEIEKVQEEIKDSKLEILFVNDGSTDQTLAKIKSQAEKKTELVEYISFSRNFGKEAALLAGLDHALGEWVVIMDVDLQDPPELLPEMYNKLISEKRDVVATRRTDRSGEPPIRSWFADLFYKLNNKMSKVKLVSGARDYRIMTQQVKEAITSLSERNRFSKGLFSWVGFDVVYIEYENVPRHSGESSWSFWSLFDYAIEGFINFSDMPLRLVSYIGIFTFVAALLIGIYLVIRTLIFGNPVAGWTSLAVLIVGMGGLQLLCLGVIGKYLSKIFIESKERPLYIIKEAKLNSKDED